MAGGHKVVKSIVSTRKGTVSQFLLGTDCVPVSFNWKVPIFVYFTPVVDTFSLALNLKASNILK